MIKVLRSLLCKIIDEIDAGNTELDEDQVIKLIDIIKDGYYKNNPLSKYQAYTYLNVSRATFDNMVKNGQLPPGEKVPGFKELFWYRKDLDKIIKK